MVWGSTNTHMSNPLLNCRGPVVLNLTTTPDRPNPTMPKYKIVLAARRDTEMRFMRPRRVGILGIGRPPRRPAPGKE